jgi:prepilin-type N-terminal cleavage/methylation domain-containing protein
MKTKRGFTLVELLVVIAIIALLMGILMPALSRVRQLAFRLTCGTNLSGIGKAMLIYANDYEDELPRAGGRTSQWGPLPNAGWRAVDRKNAFGLDGAGAGGKATVSSCFYLLVKYAEVTPKSFICKGDAGTTEFKLSEMTGLPTNFELIDAWDFGPSEESFKHCSYAYHVPFGLYALTTSGEPGLAVAADRNPWLKSPAAEAAKWNEFKPDVTYSGGAIGTSDTAKKGNAIAHQLDGQNVLFLDSHVEFAKRAYCSVEDDNIYTISRDTATGKGDTWGAGIPVPGATCVPANRKDSVLVHDPDQWGPKGRFCFAAETPAWIGGRLMPIAKAAVGDTIAARRCGGMIVAAGAPQIEAVDAHEGVFADSRYVVLETGEMIHVIGSHLFLLDGGTWATVQKLEPGSVLRTMDATVRVAAVLELAEPYIGTVYNLKIKNSDRYLIGRAGVVARDY